MNPEKRVVGALDRPLDAVDRAAPAGQEGLRHHQKAVTDQQGLDTTVAIFNVETGNKLDKKLFKIPYSLVTQANRERRNQN